MESCIEKYGIICEEIEFSCIVDTRAKAIEMVEKILFTHEITTEDIVIFHSKPLSLNIKYDLS